MWSFYFRIRIRFCYRSLFLHISFSVFVVVVNWSFFFFSPYFTYEIKTPEATRQAKSRHLDMAKSEDLYSIKHNLFVWMREFSYSAGIAMVS